MFEEVEVDDMFVEAMVDEEAGDGESGESVVVAL